MPAKPLSSPPTHLQALKHFRWVQRQDAVIGTILVLAFLLCCGMLAMGMTSQEVFVSLVGTMMLLSGWVVILMFRSSWFVLLLMARCKMLPNTTARYATAYLQKRAPVVEEEDQPPPKIEGIHLKALVAMGWIKPIDGLFALATLILWGLCVGTFLQHDVNLAKGLLFGCFGFFNISLWSLMLAFRCSWFILQLSADLRKIPEEAIRLIFLFERRA